MKSARLDGPAPDGPFRLRIADVALRTPGPGEVLLRVRACGVCLTDIHIARGEVAAPAWPVVPGHQVVGVVEAVGGGVTAWATGDRAGVPWLHATCGTCPSCVRGDENLCPDARFTGLHVPGGYAEAMVADARALLRLPASLSDVEAAPLLCAGMVGYRSLRRAGVLPGDRVGLFGFGASAHLVLQVLRHWNCEVYAFTRGEGRRELAADLGAVWAGAPTDVPPVVLDRAVVFAPAGELVPVALERLRPGGTLAINAIHMTDVPSMPYRLLWGERTVTSVANLTHRDGEEFLALCEEANVRATTTLYPWEEAARALDDVANHRLKGAAVLSMVASPGQARPP